MKAIELRRPLSLVETALQLWNELAPYVTPIRVSELEPLPPPVVEALPEPATYDEDGRRYAFRFAPAKPAAYAVDRERLFEFVKRRRRVMAFGSIGDGAIHYKTQRLLPDASERAYLRALKHAVDFFEDVRDLQTHADVETLTQRKEHALGG